MRALLFLYVRTFVNGVKRAFSSPTRVIGVIFFILIQFSWLGRFFFQGSAVGLEELNIDLPKMTLPPLAIIDACVFAAFAVLMLLFVINLFNSKTTFRAADVDVLFPTPVDPRTVLVLRVLRDIWLSMIVPLIFAVLLWRPVKLGWASLFANVPNPAMANMVFRVGVVAYLLSAIAWVWIGHASTLVLSKPDQKTDRLRLASSWVIGLAYLALAASVYFRTKGGELPNALVNIAHAPDLRAGFFLASAATAMTMAPVSGNWGAGIIGLASLVGIIVAALTLARSKTEWLYENAALRTNVTETTQKLRRSGDMMAMAVNRAQTGKLRAGRKSWLHRVTWRGPFAMVWKELLVQKRTSRWSTYLFTLMSMALSFLACAIPSRRSQDFGGIFLLLMQSMVMLGPAMGFAQAGFIESLRRIDLLKPIPFKSSTIVLFEVVCKATGSWAAVIIGLLTALFLKPALWQFVLGGLLMFPALTLALSSVSLLLVLLLPDVDDPTQRGFRGLATMLGMVAVSGPPVAVFAGLIYFKVPVALASLVATVLMLGVAWLATVVAGRTYEDFNPSD